MNEYIGIVVQSKAGHDKGKFFIIVDTAEEGYVAVADGRTKTVERPKRKNIKHLKVFDSRMQDCCKDNLQLRNMLDTFCEELACKEYKT